MLEVTVADHARPDSLETAASVLTSTNACRAMVAVISKRIALTQPALVSVQRVLEVTVETVLLLDALISMSV